MTAPSLRSARLGPSLALALLALAPAARAQDADGAFYSPKRTFLIPFAVDANDRTLQQVRLHVSDDRGRTYTVVATLTLPLQPEERVFRFTAPRDGWYWFVVQTQDADSSLHPANLHAAPPGLKVCVDSRPPDVSLSSVPQPRDGLAGVDWEVSDDNLKLPTFRLEYRVLPSSDWKELKVVKAPVGEHSWNAGTVKEIEVRLTVADRAGNETAQTTRLAARAAPGPTLRVPPLPSLEVLEVAPLEEKRWLIQKQLIENGRRAQEAVTPPPPPPPPPLNADLAKSLAPADFPRVLTVNEHKIEFAYRLDGVAPGGAASGESVFAFDTPAQTYWVIILAQPRLPTSESWLGKTVLPTRHDLNLEADGKAEVKDVPLDADLCFTVEAEHGNRLKVRRRSLVGWCARGDMVPCDDAVRYFTERLRGETRDAYPFAARGLAWQARGEYAIALKDFDEAVQLAPTEPAWRVARGGAWLAAKEPSKALAAFSEAVKNAPRCAAAYRGRAQAYLALKDVDKALDDFNEALRHNPTDAWTYYERGQVYESQKSLEKALHSYAEAVRLAPRNADAAGALARVQAACPPR